ncbi:MAG TPA: MFS transporter [Kribbella sp.]|nr:MFS transporter [Kribbella sp.]
MTVSSKPLWQEPDFRRLWAGQTVSVLGGQVTLFALPVVAVLLLHADASGLALIRALEFAPFALLTLPVGLWLDRRAPRPAMLGANVVRALTIGAAALAGLTGNLTLALLCVIVFVLGAATVVFDLAYLSYVPALVRRDRLVEGNSKLAVSDSVAAVAGPGLAGLLIQAITPPAALLLDSLSYIASIVSLRRIRATDRPPVAPPDEGDVLRRITEGIRAVARDRYLRVICVEAFSYNLFIQFGATLTVLYALRDLGLTATELGVYTGAGSIGAVAGSVFAPATIRLLGFGPTFVGGAVIACVAPVLVPLIPPGSPAAGPVVLSSYLLTGFGVTISVIGSVTLRQSVTPDHLLGRVNAAMRFVGYSALPLGAMLSGAVAAATSTRTALYVGAAALALPVLILAFSPVPRLRDPHQAVALTGAGDR